MLDIEERTICANLEKSFTKVKFKRKMKTLIRENIINFIKFKTNEHLKNFEHLSPINIMEEGLKFLDRNFMGSTHYELSFNSIIGIKKSFLEKYKEDIFNSINPSYYEMDNVPACLKNDKETQISKDFVLMIALRVLTNSRPSLYTYNQATKQHIPNVNFKDFKTSIDNYLLSPLDDNFSALFESKQNTVLTYDFMNYLCGTFNHDFYSSNGRIRNTVKIKDMRNNFDLIYSKLQEEDKGINSQKEDFILRLSASVGAQLEDNSIFYNFIDFLLKEINIEKAFKDYRFL